MKFSKVKLEKNSGILYKAYFVLYCRFNHYADNIFVCVQGQDLNAAITHNLETDYEAIHIDIFKGQGFIDEVSELDVSKSYYIYCRSGNRSNQACAVMQQLGFKKTYNLLGGFNEWEGEVESK